LVRAGACAGGRASCCKRRPRASTRPSWCAWAPAIESVGCGEAQSASGCALSLRAALAQEVFGALSSGGSLVVVAPGGEKDTQHLARVCRRQSVTCLCLVPSQLEALLRVRPRSLPCGLLSGRQLGTGRQISTTRGRAGARLQGVRIAAQRDLRRRSHARAADQALRLAVAACPSVQRLRTHGGDRGVDR